MDIAVKKINKLLGKDQPVELRASALMVITALSVKDSETLDCICKCVDDADPHVRAYAVVASGKLNVRKALPQLLEIIPHGGDLSKLACDAAAQLGAEGVSRLQELMGQVAPGIRRYIAASLTGAGGGAGVSVRVLLDSDPQVASSAAQAIIARIPTLTASHKSELVDELTGLISDKKQKLSPHVEIPILKVLASLNDPRAADLFWDRAMPPYPHEIRALALQAVGGWLKSPSKDRWKRLFQCAQESDFHILAPTLAILQKLESSAKHRDDWLKLLTAPDVSTRRLAMEKLGNLDTSEYSEILMEMIGHPDRGLSDAARQRLAKIEHGRLALVAALLKKESYEELWQLTRIILPFVSGFSSKQKDQLFNRACQFVETEDHRSDPLFALLREADASGLKDQLLEKAVAKRKKADYATAVKYLKLLARDPSAGFAIRLELAMNSLKLSPKEMAYDQRINDHTLKHFSSAIGQNSTEALKQVEKAKWLEAEDLFYLGFHFVESSTQEKSFGVAVLQHLVKAHGRSKIATNARNKLKSLTIT